MAAGVVLGAFSLVGLADTIVREGPSPFVTWVSYLAYGSFLVFALAIGRVLWAALAGSMTFVSPTDSVSTVDVAIYPTRPSR